MHTRLIHLPRLPLLYPSSRCRHPPKLTTHPPSLPSAGSSQATAPPGSPSFSRTYPSRATLCSKTRIRSTSVSTGMTSSPRATRTRTSLERKYRSSSIPSRPSPKSCSPRRGPRSGRSTPRRVANQLSSSFSRVRIEEEISLIYFSCHSDSTAPSRLTTQS